ncbi:MAG: peptidase and subtilisin kexin sedolisin, partial [Proteobacteria bacterium]|nr:peptidase and subtilisin kexin sedolisin [Pseudomonadota bacterium]
MSCGHSPRLWVRWRVGRVSPGSVTRCCMWLDWSGSKVTGLWPAWNVKALNLDPELEFVGLNYKLRVLFAPNDPLHPYQWHYPQINLPQAWDVTTGANAIVAVIDTGVVLSHPDLQGQLIAGYDFIQDPAVAVDGDG